MIVIVPVTPPDSTVIVAVPADLAVSTPLCGFTAATVRDRAWFVRIRVVTSLRPREPRAREIVRALDDRGAAGRLGRPCASPGSAFWAVAAVQLGESSQQNGD